MKSNIWSVYMLECADGTIYTGISNDVDKRISDHNKSKGAKYTRSRLPVFCLATWKCGTRSKASKEEHRVKKLTKLQKIRLIEDKNGR